MKYIFIIFIVLGLFTSCNSQNEGVHKTVDKEEFGKVMLSNEDCQLLDVRTAEEFSEGHIEKSVNIDVTNPNFVEKIKSLDKNKPTLVYCRSGKRSAKSMEILKENGFVYVLDLDGGYVNWINE